MQKLVRMEEVLHERVIGQDEAVARGGQRHPPQPGRPVRPEPADRLVPVPRPHRRRQDRAGPHARRVPVRRRAGHGPHRHVASTWRSTRCRRLVGAPPGYVGYDEGGQLTEAVRRRPVRGGAARRDREGPPRRVQRPAAGARRRPPHRRPGPHGRLHQRRADHDVEPAGRARSTTSSPSSSTASTTSCGSARSPRTTSRRIVDIQLARLRAAAGRAPHRARGHRRGRGAAGPRRATTRPSAPGRSSG